MWQKINTNKKFLLLLLPLSEHRVLLKAALYLENSQIRSTWNKEANIHIKIMGIVNSPHSSDTHFAWKVPTTTIRSFQTVLLFPPLLTPMPKNGETPQSQDNRCRRVKAARTNCSFSFQLQTEWKPKHCWWKLPNTLFRNSSAHVLWVFFPV